MINVNFLDARPLLYVCLSCFALRCIDFHQNGRRVCYLARATPVPATPGGKPPCSLVLSGLSTRASQFLLALEMLSNRAVIHVLDDDGLSRGSLAALLAAAQFNVRTHKSAIAFLTNLPEIEFGCIVTDLYMPCVDGIELIGHLRARGASTPVIVLSGRGDVPIAVKAMRAGAIEFLEKPADADELVAWVRSALVYQNAAPTYVSPG